jgi:hypothetical protein
MASHNRLTIYSNGFADFRRVFALPQGEPQEIALDVKKPHVADVLASLNIYGPATLVAPPTFSPENEHRGNLEIDPERAIEKLAARLVGAKVRIDRGGSTPIVGSLVGLHTEEEPTTRQPAHTRYLVVLTESGLAKLPIREAARLAFEEPAVQQEIAKALRRRAESLKPESTQIRFALAAAEPGAEAVVQYTVPAAAWKISYRLRELEAGRFTLQGLAIIDNNTDEDWNDFLVTVVTGQPISFSTDLAEAKVPFRSRVNVVQDSALGAVEVDFPLDALASAPMAGGGGIYEALPAETLAKMRKAAPAAAAMLARSSDESRTGGISQHADYLLADAPSQLKPQADTREIGDYCLYECRRPVSIGANRSAIIPVFETELADALCVLYYKRDQHAERPYRAIKLTNPGPQSLGRGVCTVFQGGIYGGHCVVPATKPGEERLMPFALETGVRVAAEVPKYETRIAKVSIADGVCWQTRLTVRETTYLLKSSRDEQFTVVLDHQQLAKRSKVRITRENQQGSQTLDVTQKLPDGFRLEFSLAGKERTLLRLVESKSERTRIDLGDAGDLPKLQVMFDDADGPLVANPEFQRCLEIQAQVAAKREEIARANSKIQSQSSRQERLRKNLGVAGNDEQSARWRAELGEAESKITELEQTTLPRLESQRRDLESQLREALKTIVLEWTLAGTAEEPPV